MVDVGEKIVNLDLSSERWQQRSPGMRHAKMAPKKAAGCDMEKYIQLFTDFGFKKVFGEEPNKDVLISFLNVLLLGKH